MLAEGFADINPVANVLLIVAALALVTTAVVFLGPMERFINRLTRSRASGGADTPAAGVLWVDDRPEHNARLLDGLREQGVRVDVARTTTEALDRLGQRDYTIIVSDLSRVDHPGEGLQKLEQASGATQVLVFSRFGSNSETYRDHGVAVVSSEAEIKDWLRSVDLLP